MKVSEPSTGNSNLWNTGTDVAFDFAILTRNETIDQHLWIDFSRQNVEKLTCERLRLQCETNHEVGETRVCEENLVLEILELP